MKHINNFTAEKFVTSTYSDPVSVVGHSLSPEEVLDTIKLSIFAGNREEPAPLVVYAGLNNKVPQGLKALGLYTSALEISEENTSKPVVNWLGGLSTSSTLFWLLKMTADYCVLHWDQPALKELLLSAIESEFLESITPSVKNLILKLTYSQVDRLIANTSPIAQEALQNLDVKTNAAYSRDVGLLYSVASTLESITQSKSESHIFDEFVTVTLMSGTGVPEDLFKLKTDLIFNALLAYIESYHAYKSKNNMKTTVIVDGLGLNPRFPSKISDLYNMQTLWIP